MRMINSFKKSPFGLLFLSTLSAFIKPILLFRSTILVRDWGLFNSLSLFNHSCFTYYKTWPVHNPYVLGGMDVLANPQARSCSPLVLFDLFFHAPIANLLALFTLSCIGILGFYKLLIYLGHTNKTAQLMAFIFIHASWFHLHFAEGHIIFGSFLLIGWIMLCALRFEENRFKLLLAVFLAFMLLDGGMYAFIYSTLTILLLHLFRFEGLSFKRLWKAIRSESVATGLAVLSFVGLAAFKIIPLLSLHASRAPILEWIRLDVKSLIYAFFYPFGHIELNDPDANFKQFGNFHEIGTYIGLCAVFLILVYLIRNTTRQLIPYVLILFTFLWMGSGWLWTCNPWRLIQKIPLINNAHIQTRCFFLVFFISLLLLAKALQWLESSRKTWWIIGSFLILESSWMAFYPYYKLSQSEGSHMPRTHFPSCIKNRRIDVTHLTPDASGWGFDFEHYRRFNAATKNFMDPSNKTTAAKACTESGYMGESYVISGSGRVKVEQYTPGVLVSICTMNTGGTIEFNTNFLGGWRCKEGFNVFDNHGLLAVQVPPGNSRITLFYAPNYLPFCVMLASLGIISSVLLMLFFNSSQKVGNLRGKQPYDQNKYAPEA